MSDKDTAVQTAEQDGAMIPAEYPARIVEHYAAIVATVPEAGNEGMASILEQIADARTMRQIDSPWQAGGLAQWRDRAIVVHGMRRMESDYEGGLPWFLILDCADPGTGETFTAMTGSVSIVAQLLQAWSLGGFPYTCVPRLARKPSANGFYPMHLETVRA